MVLQECRQDFPPKKAFGSTNMHLKNHPTMTSPGRTCQPRPRSLSYSKNAPGQVYPNVLNHYPQFAHHIHPSAASIHSCGEKRIALGEKITAHAHATLETPNIPPCTQYLHLVTRTHPRSIAWILVSNDVFFKKNIQTRRVGTSHRLDSRRAH